VFSNIRSIAPFRITPGFDI